MTFLQAIFLGLIQGATEFFPISSSAHLRLARWLMHIPDDLFFDLVCHTGTLFALLIVLRKEIWETLKSPKIAILYFLALIPLIPGYFFLKPFREALSAPQYLGYAFMVSALLLFAAAKKRDVIEKKKWQHVLCIGMVQTMALIPGISRSGSTIAAARLCGWDWVQAAKFSFLLAIPTILGGQFLEIVRGEVARANPWGCYVGGFWAAFALGLLGVRAIFWVYETGKVRPMAWYCLTIGLFAWIYLNG